MLIVLIIIRIVKCFQLQVQLHLLVRVGVQISIEIARNGLTHCVVVMEVLLVLVVLYVIGIVENSAAVLRHDAG